MEKYTDSFLDQLRSADPSFLTKARKKGYVCPKCGNGTGSDGDGITRRREGKYHCFVCSLDEDTIGLYGLHAGLTSFPEQVEGLANYLHIPVGTESTDAPKQSKAPEKKETPTEEPKAAPADYTAYILSVAKNIEQTDYHRGITEETLRKYKVGFDAAWKNPAKPNAPASPRLIVPTSRHSYLARLCSSEKNGYEKIKVGPVHTFNLKEILQNGRPIFITEGELTALSIIDVGGRAVAAGSAGMGANFLKELDELLKENKLDKPAAPLIIAADNDEPGKRLLNDVARGLEERGIKYSIAPCFTGGKDANDGLTSDRDRFKNEVLAAERLAYPEKIESIEQERASAHLQGFINGIASGIFGKPQPTGFNGLDTILDGGLYPGLYCVGAVSSLGKTTLVLQIADYIAGNGRDVLFFSMEMARIELMAKSISRNMYIISREKAGDKRYAKTVRQILNAEELNKFTEEEDYIFKAAAQRYAKAAEHLIIKEAVGDVDVKAIRQKIEDYITINPEKEKPVVFVDYLQILAPYDTHNSDKQNTDRAVLELKRISRDYSIPIVAVSSFNRESYTEPVSQTAFKESGAIEYGSDVLIGLQLSGMDYQEREKDGERLARIRKLNRENIDKAKAGEAFPIQAKILKNRNGSRGDVELYLTSKFSFIEDVE